MSHYIVRIYRREKQRDQCDRLYGVLENVATGDVSVFRGFEELWTVLSTAESVQHGIVGEKGWEDQREKRRDHRFSFCCAMEYRMKDGTAGSSEHRLASGRLVNISRSGMRVQAKGRKLQKGSALQIFIPMTEAPVPFPVMAMVKWVRQETSGSSQVGLQF